MNIEHRDTGRGFGVLRFKDWYGHPSSLQQSSLAFVNAIWFGLDLGSPAYSRMHLTQEQVAELLPTLQHFAETGELLGPEDY